MGWVGGEIGDGVQCNGVACGAIMLCKIRLDEILSHVSQCGKQERERGR